MLIVRHHSSIGTSCTRPSRALAWTDQDTVNLTNNLIVPVTESLGRSRPRTGAMRS